MEAKAIAKGQSTPIDLLDHRHCDMWAMELQGRRAQAIIVAGRLQRLWTKIATGLGHVARTWVGIWRHQSLELRSYAQLQRLDRRLLDDIGLTRDRH